MSDAVVARVLTANAVKKARRWQSAIAVSTKVINETPVKDQKRFTSVKDIIDQYKVMGGVDVTFDNLDKEHEFCARWVQMHEKMLDDLYIAIASRAYNNPPPNPTPNPTIQMIFKDWGSSCTVELAIDPKLQESIEKNRIPRRPKMVITREDVELARANILSEQIED